MKECPTCNLCFDDEARFCPGDGGRLVDSLPGSRELDGRWRLERVVGVGRNGTVYAATDLAEGREALVKAALPTLFAEPGSLEAFLEDAELLATLEHPNIARTYGAGLLPTGGAYIATEYVAGRSLKRAIAEDGPFPLERAVEIGAALAGALAAAHRLSILHRDVKPDNVLLGEGDGAGTARLVDFGAAKWLHAPGGSAVTATGSLVIRMPHYSSPEQCRGEAIDERSDLYSLGVVLYEMLTGRPPFDAPSPMAVIVKHVTEAPEPPTRLRPEISSEVECAVLRALEKAPGDRFQTAAEMEEALRGAACAAPDAPQARRANPWDRAAAATPRTGVQPEPVEQRRIPQPPTPLPMRMTIVDAGDEQHASRRIDGLVRDVSENGMRIETGTVKTGHLSLIRDHTTAFKNRLEIEVDLPAGTVRISGFAAWFRPAPDGVNWNVGVYIREMSREDRNRYQAYLEGLARPDQAGSESDEESRR